MYEEATSGLAAERPITTAERLCAEIEKELAELGLKLMPIMVPTSTPGDFKEADPESELVKRLRGIKNALSALSASVRL